MSQSKLSSALESLLNQASGFALSVAVWEFAVKPIWGIQTSMGENLTITALFTVVSMARSYAWRRFFNRLHNKNKKANHDCSNHCPHRASQIR